MAKAVNYATARGVLVVSAAGNAAVDLDHSGSLIQVPAQSGSGLGVSATGPVGYGVGWPGGATNFRRPASYTNYGNSAIWLAAPGGDFVLPGSATCSIPRVPPIGFVTFPCWVFDMVASPSGRVGGLFFTGWTAGTSMAAPAVSAVAALVKQAFPGISVGDLKNVLANTADDEGAAGHDPFYGRGFVNARRAVTEGGAFRIAPEGGQRQVLQADGVWLAPRPNPASQEATLRFVLPRETEVSLVIHDAAGRQVRALASGRLGAGQHAVTWDMRDQAGRRVSPGIYFTKIGFDGNTYSGRIVRIP